MISVDTNIIISLLNQKDVNHSLARRLLTQHATERLVIAPVVYAELMAAPDHEGIQAFLTRADIATLEEMPLEVWKAAGTAFGTYAIKRKKGRLPRRIIADFLIAAHATHYALKVLTFDTTIYKAVYPELNLIDITS